VSPLCYSPLTTQVELGSQYLNANSFPPSEEDLNEVTDATLDQLLTERRRYLTRQRVSKHTAKQKDHQHEGNPTKRRRPERSVKVEAEEPQTPVKSEVTEQRPQTTNTTVGVQKVSPKVDGKLVQADPAPKKAKTKQEQTSLDPEVTVQRPATAHKKVEVQPQAELATQVAAAVSPEVDGKLVQAHSVPVQAAIKQQKTSLPPVPWDYKVKKAYVMKDGHLL
jgi:hypothetical protein